MLKKIVQKIKIKNNLVPEHYLKAEMNKLKKIQNNTIELTTNLENLIVRRRSRENMLLDR